MGGLTLLVVLGIAGGGWWLLEQRAPSATAGPAPSGVDRDQTEEAVAGSLPLKEGEDYYVHVRLVEVRDTNGGSSWDAGGGAPDLYVRLTWNGTPVHDSAHRGDSLTAEWDLMRVNVKDAVLTNEIDVASAINAPIIQSGPGGLLGVEIWDDDDLSPRDAVGRFDLPVKLLQEGVQTFRFDGGNVARLEIDLIPASLTLPELIDRYSNR